MRNGFTRKTSWLWQNTEKILIILFLATFTLNIRKVFLTPYSFLNGTFNEYLTMSFSWADALMIATIIIYTIKYIICQSKSGSSSLHETSQGNTTKENNKGYLSSVIHCITNASCETYFLLLFIAWCFISIIWSPYKPIAVYRCLTLLEILLFFFIAYKNLVANSRFLRISFVALIANGFIQAIIGILQFIYGHSLGLRLFGESIVSRETPGVAKLVIDGEKHIRAYGTFPHPNILAGFLIIPLIMILISLLNRWQPKLFFNSASSEETNQSKLVSRATSLNQIPASLILVFLFIIGLGFILAFSRSAFLGLFAALLFILYSFIRNLKCKKQISIVLLFIIIASVGSIYFVNRNTSLFSDQSMRERASYANVARETISAHPLAGIGIGQFALEEYSENPNLEGWQYQPVHNVYLLLASELGIAGLVLFLIFMATLFLGEGRGGKDDYRLTYYSFCCIILPFLVIALFDHYFWDIKTGTIIFSLIITFILLRNRNLVIN
ncbi:MAG: O-antigen ligase family protein [Candidatus Moranbacteria bacterium]|nr:O-antigen ligase family protein [Candidatus Moranbacteria bacterium]